ncbi:MAG: LL-diaminopimelate aminotransferase [Desulfovibrio desulfuricans]|jgi:LL-diaminopimelate aminotransferase|nr:LL-diaminopimelate aminotransferase [Desulfovibrio desulfuricans]
MPGANRHFLELQGSYLFSEVARRVAAHRAAHPGQHVISLGIGDVTRPLAPAVLEALHKAVEEMGRAATFRGYGPEQGYAFLREAIAAHDYAARGADVAPDEIFISDGAKSDLGNFQELFAPESVVAVTDPVYPVYVDSNVMAGRAGTHDGARWSRILYLPCTCGNNFVPDIPASRPDIIYICSPNNPTGTALRRDALQQWVDYARREGCVILYDSAYEAFITEPDIPHSIYELEGAREVAVEFRSFSKTAGFTGLRCAYTVVPRSLTIADGRGGRTALRELWNRRQTTKYNGCPYLVQRAAEAVYSPAGRFRIAEDIGGYHANARRIAAALRTAGLTVFGGVNAPYLWVATPRGMSSWEFFDRLLTEASLVCTPGAGFGASGEGYVRLTAFGAPDDTEEALRRLAAVRL